MKRFAPIATSYIITSANIINQAINYSDLSTDENLPVYRKSDVEKHTDKETGIWVTYKGGVYDITSFVANHPGGQDKILLAKGKDLEPFWRIYQQHYNSKLPLETLSQLKIGILHSDDLVIFTEKDNNDPYSQEPDESLLHLGLVHSKKPINAEPPRNILTDSWITPNDLWFIRNHHPSPVNIDPKTYSVSLEIPFKEKKTINLSIDNIKEKYKKYSVVTSIQCGGNRRLEMNKFGVTAGSPWEIGAIATAKFSGTRLCDVLKSFGINLENARELGIKHVQFFAVEGVEVSIPIKKALDPDGDVLLAYEMNDKDIPLVHGYPLRLIVPGHVGIRNLKWVSRICLSHEEAHGTWQRGMAYKGLPPSAKTLDGIDVERIPSLQEQPVQSAVTYPLPGTIWSPGEIYTIKGYSYSGGGKGIVRVDVSIDGGETWKTAKLLDGSEQPLDRAWAWTLWECDVEIPSDSSLIGKSVEIVCKATDVSYNVQPDSIKGLWNLRGILNNAWHRVQVPIKELEEED